MTEPCCCSTNIINGEYDAPMDDCVVHGIDARPIISTFSEEEMEIVVEALARYENDDLGIADRVYRRLISRHFRHA